MQLYEQALEIKKNSEDSQGQIRILANMARVLQESKDHNQAFELFQKALNLSYQLNEPFSIANVLLMMSESLFQIKEFQKALKCLVDAFNLFVKLQATYETEVTVSEIRKLEAAIGEPEFIGLWDMVTNSPLPDWLVQSPEEQFAIEALQSALEKRPEAEEYYKSAQKMAADANAPAEIRELGRVLVRIMAGDTKVDLSGLPARLAETVSNNMK